MSPSRPAGPRSPAPGRPAAPRRTAPASAPTPVARPTPASKPTPAPRGKPVTAPTPAVPEEDQAPFSRAVTTYSAGGARRYAGPVAAPVVSTSSAARFAERSRARRNLARRQVLLVAGSTVVVAALGWLLFFSPVLALDPAKVRVEGAGTVVAVDQVLGVVGAHATTPLPRLDTVGLRDEVLEVPGVREARVTREWPHGLAVVLVAREPVAAVPEQVDPATPGAVPAQPGFALLDMDGVQVGRVDAAPEGLPVVDVPVGDKRTLRAVLSVLQRLPADLLAQVGDVSARTQDTVTMNLRDGVRVDWGSASETPLKIAVLSALRTSPAAAGATVIDVSAPRLPITK
ncbi:cell division protein FtsQ/DivIB [Cellulomonas xylanilytica]|uniref:Cell division protein n=1 Tax=Cellulomonas xylanilytica TaxID=233583 RepID=A0A510V138_9CELL|nr:FtsQ-type POTRA domain-containing protein [Cellulomonas xylanilytica]GEK20617.1 cell division protein [Cellulomonas xylanilytica]